MKYRNRLTGNVIDVPCEVSGPDLEPVKEKETDQKAEPVKKTKKKTED